MALAAPKSGIPQKESTRSLFLKGTQLGEVAWAHKTALRRNVQLIRYSPNLGAQRWKAVFERKQSGLAERCLRRHAGRVKPDDLRGGWSTAVGHSGNIGPYEFIVWLDTQPFFKTLIHALFSQAFSQFRLTQPKKVGEGNECCFDGAAKEDCQ